jgi:hypothetical protein
MDKDFSKVYIWGAWWGVAIVGFFALGAILTFALLTVLGVETVLGALIALFAGPVIGTLFFLPFWKRRKPIL